MVYILQHNQEFSVSEAIELRERDIYPDQESMSDMDYVILYGFKRGFSFLANPKAIPLVEPSMMDRFSRYNISDPHEKKVKSIEMAYLAVQKANKDVVMPVDEAVTLIDRNAMQESPADADVAVNDAVLAFDIDSVLERAYDLWLSISFDQKRDIVQLTQSFSHKNVGALKVLHDMTSERIYEHPIPEMSAKISGNLIRLAILAQQELAAQYDVRPISISK
jgi:hypothetical protein